MGLIWDSYQVMQDVHRYQLRETGEPYKNHPIAVAFLYHLIYPHDNLGFCICLLHDVGEGSWIRIVNLARFFDWKVALMVDALTKRDRNDFRSQDERLSENYSRLFPAARMDKRIAMVKMCDRIHNVSTIDALDYRRAMRVINETEKVLLPFFRSLNLPLTEELASLCFSQRWRLGLCRGTRIQV